MIDLKTKYTIAGVLALFGLVFLLGYQKGKASFPAKVDNHVVEELNQQVIDLTVKLGESETMLQKLKSEKTNKSKRLITNVDGSSVLIENESSESTESELAESRSKTAEYQQMVLSLQTKVETEQKIRDDLLRVNANIVYDSERGVEYDGNAGYKFFSATAGANPEKKAWRVGGGVGFSF